MQTPTHPDALVKPLEEAARSFGVEPSTAVELLGEKVLDAYWSGVPKKAWSYTVGGYGVLKKWLFYREQRLLGRDLRPEEAREFSAMVGRISALLLPVPPFDANYRRAARSASVLSAPGVVA